MTIAVVFMCFSRVGLVQNRQTFRVRAALRAWLQRSVRRCLVDDLRQVFRQQLKGLVDRQPEMAGEFLHLGVAENRLQLLSADWKIGPVAEPGFDLCVEAALLQRRHEPIEIVVFVLARTALTSAGKAAASASPTAPLSMPPRLSNKPMMASIRRECDRYAKAVSKTRRKAIESGKRRQPVEALRLRIDLSKTSKKIVDYRCIGARRPQTASAASASEIKTL